MPSKKGVKGRFKGIFATKKREAKPISKDEEDKFWQDAFKVYDKNHDGVIEKDELKDVLEKILGKPPTEIQLGKIFDKVDLNHNGMIEYSEFVKMMNGRKDQQDDYISNFRKFDVDNNGYISKEELMSVLNSVEKTSEDEVDEIIAMVDQGK